MIESVSNPFTQLPEMVGPGLLLRPIKDSDSEALYLAASDPLIWEQNPDPLRYQRDRFKHNYLDGALASNSALVAIERATGKIVGCSRYYEWDPELSEVAIGYTFIVRSHWGGATNRELKQLMFDYAFKYVKKIWLHIGTQNWRSRKGSEKVGAVFSHEGFKELNGQQHPYVFYYVTRDT